jgi:hypothetical protein
MGDHIRLRAVTPLRVFVASLAKALEMLGKDGIPTKWTQDHPQA